MAISEYWVGQIPARPISISVKDSYGNNANLSSYDEYNVHILGSDNEELDLTGYFLNIAGASDGRFVFTFPKDRSIFDKPGEYLMQLEFVSLDGSKDITSVHHIKVRRLGGND